MNLVLLRLERLRLRPGLTHAMAMSAGGLAAANKIVAPDLNPIGGGVIRKRYVNLPSRKYNDVIGHLPRIANHFSFVLSLKQHRNSSRCYPLCPQSVSDEQNERRPSSFCTGLKPGKGVVHPDRSFSI